MNGDYVHDVIVVMMGIMFYNLAKTLVQVAYQVIREYKKIKSEKTK